MNILLVDDDAAVLQALQAALQQNPSLNVAVASDGPTALQIAGTLGSLDVLVTDVVMEPMDGFTLRNEIASRHPSAKVVFISGYDLSEYAAYIEGCDVLTKPFTGEVLLNTVLKYMPVAVPKPVVAQPAATPVAVPKPVATPVATPQPAAAPVAVPKAVATAQAAATPVAVAKPAAAPKPVAVSSPTAKPVATAAAVPAAKPAAAVAAKPAVAVKPAAAPVAAKGATIPDGAGFASTELEGKRIGAYQMVKLLRQNEWGPVYQGVQSSMGRAVEVNVLSETVRESSPSAKEDFIAETRAKASVKHPVIVSVYEAGEVSGHTFYAYERLEGQSLAEAKAAGITIDEPTAIRLIRSVAEALEHLQAQKISYAGISPDGIYLTKGNVPRVANIAKAGQSQSEVQGDVAALAAMVSGVLPGGKASDAKLQELLDRMAQGGFASWSTLLQEVKGLEKAVVPADAIKLTAQEQAAIRAVELAKKQQKKQIIYGTVGVFAVLWILGALFYFRFFYTGERDLSDMVRVPAGEFIYQDGKVEKTKEFWIDKYEVTIGQYARFLADLEANPTDKYDHPDQPKGKSHYPGGKQQWDIYYGRAKRGLPAAYTPIDLNCPVFNVDFWDAYAYAKWAGKRLPTEVEWEKAARGEKGNKFPWGNEYDEKKLNGQNDYIARPGPKSKGTIDGYFKWAPVDAFPEDKSPYGVIGMGGNLAEWTVSKEGKPVIRGGYFYKNPERKDSDKPREMTVRFSEVYPEDFNEYIGFRCVSDTPPK